MKLGIMQPYFFPYIGYWQLLNAVDTYVVYDDVNFIKGGWINRNRILAHGNPQYINVILDNPSSNKRINEIKIKNDRFCYGKTLKTLDLHYRKAPYYEPVRAFLEPVLKYQTDNLAEFLLHSIKEVCSYLGIETQLILSSSLEKNNDLKGQDKVLDICSRLKATDYYNAIGGKELYDASSFLSKDIQLHFLKTDDIVYEQVNSGFVPNLSIIDVMMCNSRDIIHQFLIQFTKE